MIKKLTIKENNQIENRYATFINDKLNKVFIVDGSKLQFNSADYKIVRSLVSDIRTVLSEADFLLDSVDYISENDKSVYKYVKNEFGFNIIVTITLDETDWDNTVCTIEISAEDTVTNNDINESYDPDWVKKATDDDLISLRSELEEFDMNAERIYNAVKNSTDRNNESELSGLISAMKNINNELKEYAEAWETD